MQLYSASSLQRVLHKNNEEACYKIFICILIIHISQEDSITQKREQSKYYTCIMVPALRTK